MDSLLHLLSSIVEIQKLPIKYKFLNLHFYIYISTHKSLSPETINLIKKCSILFANNPFIKIRQPNLQTNIVLTVINNKKEFFYIKEYGITFVFTFKPHINQYFKNIFNELNLKDIIFDINKIKEIYFDDRFRFKKYHKESKLNKFNDIKKLVEGRVIGQFNKQIIILKYNNELIFCDQHAVHERIRLEILQRKISDMEVCKKKACKGAIRFGCVLKKSKIMQLIQSLIKCEYPFICAHGRPNTLKMKID